MQSLGLKFLGAFCVLFLVACSKGAGPVQAAGRKHVLLVTVEGLRGDAVGSLEAWYGGAGFQGEAEPVLRAARTPNLDGLAEGSFTYGYALATSSWCAPSIASIMASDYPSYLGFTSLERSFEGRHVTLAEVLRGAGWKTRAFVQHPFLRTRYNLDQGFEEYSVAGAQDAPGRGAETMEAALEAIGDLGSHSTFLWVQLGGLGPPFDLEDNGQPLSRSEWLRYRDQWQDEDLNILRQRYNAGVERVDHQIGQLLQALANASASQDTIVVCVASNGCELLEQDHIGDGTSLADSLVRVPLMISVAGVRQGVIEDPVSLIDLAPSLLRLVGLRAPQTWRGVSVLPREPVPERYLFSELSRARELRVALRGDHKLILDPETGTHRLYDIFADPFEQRDLSIQKGALAQELRAALRSFEEGLRVGSSDE
ncbi:MAG: sulfatase-like hydrolase/transferase [Planctomycetes bacterium]|nr:sulfatase-like hydrolase/transferase [Planctomycetota bacterium]